jgi:hypothetical protein
MSHHIVSCGATGVVAARRFTRDDTLRVALSTGVATAQAVR